MSNTHLVLLMMIRTQSHFFVIHWIYDTPDQINCIEMVKNKSKFLSEF